MAKEYTLGGPPPQSRSEKILMNQDPGPAQSRIEELLKNASGRTSGALIYKGTVETAMSLPASGNEVGDVYHVNSDGSEWGWNGTAWEELGKSSSILYTEQSLTPAQQAQARSNIDAAKLFVVRIASESDPLTANKTFAETYAAIRNGMLVRADLWDMDGDLWLDCTNAEPTQIVFGGGAFGAQMTLVFGSDESLTRTISQIPTDAVLCTPQSLTPAQQAQARENIGAASIADLGTVFTLKGGVATVNDLPQTGNSIGDVYYVESVSAGFIWITSTAYPYGYWEELGETVDLSAYAEKTWVENKGYQTARDVQTAISGVRQLPAVTASDNGKFLRVVSGAWAAQAVPSAESNSFGGGS